MSLVSRERIIELYKEAYKKTHNDVKRMALIHKETGVDTDTLTRVILEYQESLISNDPRAVL